MESSGSKRQDRPVDAESASFERLARLAAQFFKVAGVVIWSGDEAGYRLKAAAGGQAADFDFIKELAGRLPGSGLILVEDGAAQSSLAGLPALKPWRFLAGQALFVKGKVAGGLALFDPEPGPFGPAQIEALADFTALAEDLLAQPGPVRTLKGPLESFQDLLETFKGRVMFYDLDLRYTVVLGNSLLPGRFDAEAVTGRTIWEVYPAETAARVEPLFRAALQGSQVSYEFSYSEPGEAAQALKILLHTWPIWDDQGKIVGGAVMVQDMETPNLTAQALAESEARFRELTENLDDIFWLFSLEPPAVLYCSPSYEKLFGQPVQEVYSNPLSFIKTIHPDDRPDILEKLPIWSKQEFKHEFRVIRPDGEIRWVKFRVFPVLDREGTVYRMGGIIEDITQALQAEEETRRNLAKEAELNEMRTLVITLISHEFRTPLSAILSTSELLQYYEAMWTPEKKQELFRRIQISVRHMTRMLDDILVIGKAEAGRLEFRPEKLDLSELCRSLVNEMREEIVSGDRLEFVYSGGDPVVEVDPLLVNQILVNLLSNAVKYSPEDSKVQLKLTIDRTCKQAVLEVCDQGRGIPPEDLPHLYEVFHRGSNVSAVRGTGLGLPISKRSVEKHGGTIEVATELNKGTTFTVRLPIQA